MREIRFYQTWSGREPAVDFIRSLSPRQQKKVAWTLERIEQDERVSAKYLKKLSGTNGIWEVRVHVAGDAFRLLGFFDGPRLVVLVSGFAKKTEEVPQGEIETAHQRRQDYLRRKERS